ncbi:MAG: phosphoglycerate kinase [Halobacteriovorax sp.]|nr:phosphoglycerate kinase [Halobacteriovorax sp.]|tara:strand:- start:8255 stop:9439 length:1185 start_codon:yes stop_codon:yes gene_type:complete
MALKFVDELDLENKKVLARFDFNVPLSSDGKITDTTRVDLALPTIKYILEAGCDKLILMSHLGRPKGEVKKEFSLEPVATYLADQLGEDVVLTESATDRGIKTLLELNETKIILLENLRFHKEETENDHEFAKHLASYGDVYINDAFGTAHRKHASTYEINAFFKGNAAGGFLLKKEIDALSKIVNNPEKPFIAITGGAKVSDKIKIIESLLTSVDSLIVGGAMAYPFLKAKGYKVGKSLCSDEDVELAKKLLMHKSASKIMLPVDHIVSDDLEGNPETIKEVNIPDDKMGLDIGPETLAVYCNKIDGAKTLLWNGPMGLFENAHFSKGTLGIAQALSTDTGYTLVGGGDSVAAVKKSGLASKMDHVSTGGGASLEYIESGSLPGIQALKFGIN